MGIQNNETVSIIRKVYKLQLKKLQTTFTRLSGRRERILPNGWIRSVFFIGVMAFWKSTNDQRYLKAALKWTEENDWLPGPHPRLADDHCAGQIYTESLTAKPIFLSLKKHGRGWLAVSMNTAGWVGCSCPVMEHALSIRMTPWNTVPGHSCWPEVKSSNFSKDEN